MKNLMKVFSLVLVLALILVPTFSSAASISGFMGEASASAGSTAAETGVKSAGAMILNIFYTVAMVIASCMLVYVAIQWILATPAKKAEVKSRLIYLAIGVVLLVGGKGLMALIEEFAPQILNF